MRCLPLKGYVHVYTGNGKGKTTAALGITLRAAGAGMRVYFSQFAKGQRCCEHKALKRFADTVTIAHCGSKSFITKQPSRADINAARKGFHAAAFALTSGKYGLVVLDEAAYAASVGLISTDELIAAIAARSPGVEVVITGRNAPRALIRFADLVTEMNEVKHYWQKGVRARKGIEY